MKLTFKLLLLAGFLALFNVNSAIAAGNAGAINAKTLNVGKDIQLNEQLIEAVVAQARAAAQENHKKCPKLAQSISNCNPYDCDFQIPIINKNVGIKVVGKVQNNLCHYVQTGGGGDNHNCLLSINQRNHIAKSYADFINGGKFDIAASQTTNDILTKSCKKF